MKVSFDFDSTLSRKDVQKFAKKLVDIGLEVWIVTSRCATEPALAKGWHWVEKQNEELYNVAESCGIKREHIQFTEHVDKIVFLKDKGYVFHLDDDVDELVCIMESRDSCTPLNVGHSSWEEYCIEEIVNALSESTSMTKNDCSILLKGVLNPAEPNDKLREAFKRYKNEI
jgi:hypothetical protein